MHQRWFKQLRTLHRKATFRLYPNDAERQALERSLRAHCTVYNTLLETARRRYAAGLPAYNRSSVSEDVKRIRSAIPWIAERTTAQGVQMTGTRLVRAFDGFFRRIAAGGTPGFPRFKSIKRYPGWGYKQHGDGFALMRKAIRLASTSKRAARAAAGHPDRAFDGVTYGAVRLTTIGTVSMRGRVRFDGEPKAAEVFRKGENWYLSVSFEVQPEAVERVGGSGSVAFDWGVTTLATQVVGDAVSGSIETIENPRWLSRELERLAALQRLVSELEAKAKAASGREKGFPFSRDLRRAYEGRRRLHSRVARQRQDFHHKLSARMVGRFGLIVTEELATKNMVKAPAPRPDPDSPGQFLPNGASAKAGLNRAILDGAPASLVGKLRYKAEEAGSKLIEVPTRRVKPTQRCHRCGSLKKLALADRSWRCACGVHHQRDENAARTMMRYAFEGQWWLESTDSNNRAGTARAQADLMRKLHPRPARVE
jgi:putative transposase